MLTINKESLKYVVLIVFYKYLLDLSYVWTHYRYEYEGLLKISESLESGLISWCLLILLIPFAIPSFHRNTVSARIVTILFLISVVPTISLIGYRQEYSGFYVLLIMIYWAVFFLAWNLLPVITISNMNNISSLRGIYLIITISSLAVLYVWSQYAGFHIQMDLDRTIYETRTRARGFNYEEVLGFFGTLLSYVWLSADTFLTLCVIYFLYTKRYMIVCFLSIIIFINFSITATKIIIGFLVVGILGYYFYTFFSKGKYILYMLIPMMLMSFLEPLIFNTGWLNFIHYRIFFLTGELHYSFFEFFQINNFDYFAQGPLRLFTESEYDKPIAFLIGEFAIDDITARANNGLFSDAYQNLGALGVFIMPILTVLYLKLLDGVCKKHDPRLFVVVYVYVSVILISIPLSTALLSSGLLLTLFFYTMLPQTRLQ